MAGRNNYQPDLICSPLQRKRVSFAGIPPSWTITFIYRPAPYRGGISLNNFSRGLTCCCNSIIFHLSAFPCFSPLFFLFSFFFFSRLFSFTLHTSFYGQLGVIPAMIDIDWFTRTYTDWRKCNREMCSSCRWIKNLVNCW